MIREEQQPLLFIYLLVLRTKSQDARVKTSPDSWFFSPDSVFRYEESFGQLVLLGYDVTTFIPVTYQRSSLLRPSMEVSSCG